MFTKLKVLKSAIKTRYLKMFSILYIILYEQVCCTSSGNTASQKPTTLNFISEPDNGDNAEASTTATLDNKNGPIGVETHPNLGLLPLQCGNIDSDRIIGGNRTQLFEMPWMVLLSYESGRSDLVENS